MLRNISLIALFVFASFLVFGAQSRSSAQVAFSNSWAGIGRTPTLICNVQGSPDAINGGSTGYFSVSNSTLFSATGTIVAIYNSKDSAGNYYSVVIALGTYYPIVNGVQSTRPTIANYVFSMQKMANGTQWEGFSANNYYTGAPLYTTGATRDGSPYVLPVMKGSLTITL